MQQQIIVKKKFAQQPKRKQPALVPVESIKKAADSLVMVAGIATLEANQRFMAARISELEKTMNDFFDLAVEQFEKVIGHNFAAPFRERLKELAAKYDNVQPLGVILDKANSALKNRADKNE